jgi:hypothetical protein
VASSAASARASQISPVASLARFFPDAVPVRIPVEISRPLSESIADQAARMERTVIEFGTPREVLFACAEPLEFADVIHLRNSDGSLDTEASVVAVQYHLGKTVVAARFLQSIPNWIIRPL